MHLNDSGFTITFESHILIAACTQNLNESLLQYWISIVSEPFSHAECGVSILPQQLICRTTLTIFHRQLVKKTVHTLSILCIDKLKHL